MASKTIVTYIDEDRNTSLHYLAIRGELEKIEEELKSNNEIDPGNYLGWTPLMMATRYGNIDAIKYLLSKHADATRVNNFGCNILLAAVASGSLEVIAIILQHLLLGGISKQSMQHIFSPISLAILFDKIDVVKYLIEKGFCVNIATPITELTPMTFAATMRNAEIIHFLRSKGANEENKLETTPGPHHHYSVTPQPLFFVNSPQAQLVCLSPMLNHCPERLPNFNSNSPFTYPQYFFPQSFSHYSNSSNVPLPCEPSVNVERPIIFHNNKPLRSPYNTPY
uniref:Uncharacterized protein n=1 Tax=Photinus pyralis TaxID=7054 RepID=A0A1Y1LPJ5_PHOPY